MRRRRALPILSTGSPRMDLVDRSGAGGFHRRRLPQGRGLPRRRRSGYGCSCLPAAGWWSRSCGWSGSSRTKWKTAKPGNAGGTGAATGLRAALRSLPAATGHSLQRAHPRRRRTSRPQPGPAGGGGQGRVRFRPASRVAQGGPGAHAADAGDGATFRTARLARSSSRGRTWTPAPAT